MLKSIIAIIKGHLTIFKHLFKKPVTIEYPEIKPQMNENFRGKHNFDFEKCITCGMCVRVCPAAAIEILKEKDENGKSFMSGYIIDFNKCIFCGNCALYCPTKAITMSKEFELATGDKDDLVLKFYPKEVKNNE